MKEHTPIPYLILFNIGIFFLLLLVLPFTVQSLLMLVHIPVNPFVFPFAFVLAGANMIFRLAQLHVPKRNIILLAGMVVLLLAGAHIASVLVYDFSYDGLWYHQDAVILLKEGWNPYTHVLTAKETSMSDLFLNHYPKATWIAQACYYSFSNYLESAKVFNFYTLFATFFLTLAVIKHLAKMNGFFAALFALIVATNPVSVYQLFSFYVDGILGGLITCAICLMLLLITQDKEKKNLYLYLALALAFLINIKFTSLVYACVLTAGFVAYIFFYSRQQLLKYIIFYAVIFVVSVLILGYPTYVRNFLHNGHPFYPLMGENNIGERVEQAPMPVNFLDKNRFEKFNLSTFARPEWARAPLSSRAKPLFTRDGIMNHDAFKRADAEMSGFGPAYAEMLLLISGGILLLLIFDRKAVSLRLLLLLLVIVLSVVIMPAFWYARYVPQLWLVSVILTIILYQSSKLRWLSLIIILFTLINTGLVMRQNFGQFIEQTSMLNKTFEELKSRHDLPEVYDGWAASFKIKMKEHDLKYTPAVMKDPHDPVNFFPGMEMTNAFYLKGR